MMHALITDKLNYIVNKGAKGKKGFWNTQSTW